MCVRSNAIFFLLLCVLCSLRFWWVLGSLKSYIRINIHICACGCGFTVCVHKVYVYYMCAVRCCMMLWCCAAHNESSCNKMEFNESCIVHSFVHVSSKQQQDEEAHSASENDRMIHIKKQHQSIKWIWSIVTFMYICTNGFSPPECYCFSFRFHRGALLFALESIQSAHTQNFYYKNRTSTKRNEVKNNNCDGRYGESV